MKAVIIIWLLLLWAVSTWANETYEKTIAGKSCRELNQQFECRYKIGKDLDIVITAVGSPWSSIDFYKSHFGGDFHAAFGLQHFCIIIKPQGWVRAKGPGLAFISPRTGKVYPNWMECKEDY